MEKAVKNLEKKPDYLLVDGNVRLNLPFQRSCIIKGDSKSLSIACASIVAKVTRDALMEKYHTQYPDYNFKKHKGYPTKEHVSLLKKHGPTPIHRKSFKPVKNVLISLLTKP